MTIFLLSVTIYRTIIIKKSKGKKLVELEKKKRKQTQGKN